MRRTSRATHKEADSEKAKLTYFLRGGLFFFFSLSLSEKGAARTWNMKEEEKKKDSIGGLASTAVYEKKKKVLCIFLYLSLLLRCTAFRIESMGSFFFLVFLELVCMRTASGSFFFVLA